MNLTRALELYETLVLIRAVEETICAEYERRNIRGPVHLSLGQEAVAVGALAPSRKSDLCVSTHRDHAHYLAKGGDMRAMVDELYGLGTGSSRGYGGSMHLFASDVGFMGSSAVLPGSIEIATGLALACKFEGAKNICITFTGDGASDEGGFYEAINLAALLRLPVLFVCENNNLSTNTRLEDRQAQTNIRLKAKAFGLDSFTIDGTNVFEVYEAATRACRKIRRTGRPLLMEAPVTRLCSHVGPVNHLSDFSDACDPVKVCREQIEERWPDQAKVCDQVKAELERRVATTFQQANAAFEAKNLAYKLVAPPPPRQPLAV